VRSLDEKCRFNEVHCSIVAIRDGAFWERGILSAVRQSLRFKSASRTSWLARNFGVLGDEGKFLQRSEIFV
jgi:hypothetical protein